MRPIEIGSKWRERGGDWWTCWWVTEASLDEVRLKAGSLRRALAREDLLRNYRKVGSP